ncbi:MAG TPA: hypothetical protein VEF53_14845 [Patescibacteria group bacterium]|nr:hypothetical protein [Patescibacteria group bacterium]
MTKIKLESIKKYFVSFIQSDKIIILFLSICLLSFSWFYISYNQPRDIHYRYNGIKYQAGNLEIAEPILIEVKGTYLKELFVREVEIDGFIKIGEKTFNCDKMRFSEYSMNTLQSSEGHFGVILMSDMLKELTVEIHEPNQYGGYSWSGQNGWLIAAPCNNRNEAIKISNMLIEKRHKGLVIE